MPPPNPRVAKAFRAMKGLGISEEKVKPVLKKLLKLYDKNWELIEEENYRVLADLIFETEEALREKKDLENDGQMDNEPERPLKRLRLRYQEGQASPSLNTSSPSLDGMTLKRPKVEEHELPESRLQHQSQSMIESPPKRIESQPPSTHSEMHPVSSKSLVVQERSDPSRIGDAGRTQPAVMRRINSNPISSPMRLRDRGKEPLAPQIASREKSSSSDKSSHAVLFKETTVEHGIVLLPRQKKMHNTPALITPKEEPFTDDVSQFEVPLAVIHPEVLHVGHSSFENGPRHKQHGSEILPSNSVNGEDKTDGVSASSNETRSNCELSIIPDESSATLEVGSSSFGEVKISLSCKAAAGSPDFRMPSLDALLKLMEDKCLSSYKVLDPNFCVTKLMSDMCACALELGSAFTNESQETVIETSIDIMEKSGVNGASDDRGMPSYSLNGSVDKPCVAQKAPPQLLRLSAACNDVDDHMQLCKDIISDERLTEQEKEQNGLECTNSRGLVVIQQPRFIPDGIRALHDVNDIAKGQERLTISLANEINSECLPSFYYIPQNVVFQNANVNFSLARIGGDSCCATCFGDCLLSSALCACAHETGGNFVYTLEGLVKEEFLDKCISMNRDPQKHCLSYCKECPLERSKDDGILEPCKGHLVRKFIKECWSKCGCSKQCGNRVVQRGINCNLQVFMTPEGKGWGLRTLENLPKGAFVCEYVGEVLTSAELYERILRIPSSAERAYPVLLDADWGSGVLKDEEALCLYATYYGNVARFVNHSGGGNPDHHYYHLALFTTRKVEASEELTWDYGIDFDDNDHPVKAFRCRCGSKFCRNIKRSSSKYFIDLDTGYDLAQMKENGQ
ncbi:unnamed protein product [Ilex paraguariensis]|uniref:Uncharacterized protein n=1 Tax=Ilex paraguariensis TaxID=185542 RepID=A0ABC8RZG4_9AQUA